MATDPLNTHSPQGQQGPFVQGGRQGLFSRLLRGGSKDPAAPPADAQPATNTIPTPRADDAGRETRGKGHTTMAPYARPAADTGRSMPRKVLRWILRTFGLRFAIAAVALVLVAVGNIWGDGRTSADETTARLEGVQQRLEAMQDTTTPPVAGSQGRVDVAVVGVDEVEGTAQVVDGASGKRYEWLVANDAVGQAMLDNGFRSVTAHWRLDETGQARIVGVTGPRASVRPGGTKVEPGTDDPPALLS